MILRNQTTLKPRLHAIVLMISMTMSMTTKINRAIRVAVQAGSIRSQTQQVDGAGTICGPAHARTVKAVDFPKTALLGDSSEQVLDRINSA